MDHKRLKVRIPLVAGLLIAASAIFFSCESYSFDPPEVDPDVELFFAADIVPIFTAKCAGCHGGAEDPDLRAANAYAALVTDAVPATRYVNTVTPAESKIYTKLLSGHAPSTTDLEKKLKIGRAHV